MDMEKIMKQFECGTLVPGCDWSTNADDGAEVVRRAVDHIKRAHNEPLVRPSMVDAIKQRIAEAQPEKA